jgi:hypothetical protein
MPKDKEGHGIVLDEKGQEQPATRSAPGPQTKHSRATCRSSRTKKTNFNQSRKRAGSSFGPGRSEFSYANDRVFVHLR